MRGSPGSARLGAWRWGFYLGSLALLVLVQLFGTRAHLLFALLVAVVALPGVVWPSLEPHQRARLASFVQPDAEPLVDGIR